MNIIQEQINLLTLEGDAIFGLEPQNSLPASSSPPLSSPPSTTTDSDQEPQQQPPHQQQQPAATVATPTYHIIRNDPSLHALLLWSRHAVITALSRPLAARLVAEPDSVVAQAASSIVELARFRVQASTTLAMAPASFVHLQDALGLPGRAITGGPTWTVPDVMRRVPAPDGDTREEEVENAGHSLPDGVRIVTSVEEEHRRLVAGLRRPETWTSAEWSRLIATATAAEPWAMAVYHQASDVSASEAAATAAAVAGDEIICICHTPARNALVAEAGIWTRDDWRGRGLAPATVAAWARLHPPETTTLFYSTSKENTASQAVARKLGLQEFGYIWKLLAV